MDNFDELPVGGRSKVDWGDEVPVSVGGRSMVDLGNEMPVSADGGSVKVDWGDEVPVSAGGRSMVDWGDDVPVSSGGANAKVEWSEEVPVEVVPKDVVLDTNDVPPTAVDGTLDDLPIRAKGIHEVTDESASMNETAYIDTRPLSERINDKNWKSRASAYEDIVKEINNGNVAIFSEYESHIVKMLADSNASALDTGLDAVSVFIDKTPNASGVLNYLDKILSNIIDKVFNASRPATQNKGKLILSKLMEIDEPTAVTKYLLTKLGDKKLKIPPTCLEVIKEGVISFGVKPFPVKDIISALGTVFNGSNGNAREAALLLMLEMTKWIGKTPFNNLLDNVMRSAQKTEFEKLYNESTAVPGHAPTPSLWLRKERPAGFVPGAVINSVDVTDNSNGDVSGRGNNAPATTAGINARDYIEEVDILKRLKDSDFNTLINEEKWEPQAKALQLIIDYIGATPKIKVGSDVSTVIIGPIKAFLREGHFQCQILSLKIIGLLADGLRQEFGNVVRPLLQSVILKCKEKRLINEILVTLHAVLKYCCSFDGFSEDVIECIKTKKNPAHARICLIQYISNICLSIPERLPSSHVKQLSEAVLTCVEESDVQVREASCNALGLLLAIAKKRGKATADAMKLFTTLETTNAKVYKKISGSTPPTTAPAMTASATKAVDVKKPVTNTIKPVTKSATSGGASKAASTTSVKAGGDKLSSKSDKNTEDKDDVETLQMNAEEAQAILDALGIADWGSTVQEVMNGANWQGKVDILTTMTQVITDTKNGGKYSAALVAYLSSVTAKFKISNVNILKAVIQVACACAQNSGDEVKFSKAAACELMVNFGDKFSDKKTKDLVGSLLTALCEAISPLFVFRRMSNVIEKSKAPLVHQHFLEWLKDAVKEFGYQSFPLSLLGSFCQVEMDNKVSGVRQAAIEVLGGLYNQVGPRLTAIVTSDDTKPAIKALLDAEFTRIGYDATAASKVVRSVKDASDAAEAGGAMGIPRQDISTLVDNKNIISELNMIEGKTSWQNRKLAMESVVAACSRSAYYLESNKLLIDIIKGLKLRMSDTQANLKPIAANAISGVIASLDPSVGVKYIKVISESLLNGLCDNKKQMRDSTVSALQMIVTLNKGDGSVADSTLLGAFLPALGEVIVRTPIGREEILTFILSHVAVIATDCNDFLVNPLILALQDKTAAVRQLGELCLISLVKKGTIKYSTIDKIIRDLPPATKRTLQPSIDKIVSAVPNNAAPVATATLPKKAVSNPSPDKVVSVPVAKAVKSPTLMTKSDTTVVAAAVGALPKKVSSIMTSCSSSISSLNSSAANTKSPKNKIPVPAVRSSTASSIPAAVTATTTASVKHTTIGSDKKVGRKSLRSTTPIPPQASNGKSKRSAGSNSKALIVNVTTPPDVDGGLAFRLDMTPFNSNKKGLNDDFDDDNDYEPSPMPTSGSAVNSGIKASISPKAVNARTPVTSSNYVSSTTTPVVRLRINTPQTVLNTKVSDTLSDLPDSFSSLYLEVVMFIHHYITNDVLAIARDDVSYESCRVLQSILDTVDVAEGDRYVSDTMLVIPKTYNHLEVMIIKVLNYIHKYYSTLAASHVTSRLINVAISTLYTVISIPEALNMLSPMVKYEIYRHSIISLVLIRDNSVLLNDIGGAGMYMSAIDTIIMNLSKQGDAITTIVILIDLLQYFMKSTTYSVCIKPSCKLITRVLPAVLHALTVTVDEGKREETLVILYNTFHSFYSGVNASSRGVDSTNELQFVTMKNIVSDISGKCTSIMLTKVLEQVQVSSKSLLYQVIFNISSSVTSPTAAVLSDMAGNVTSELKARLDSIIGQVSAAKDKMQCIRQLQEIRAANPLMDIHKYLEANTSSTLRKYIVDSLVKLTILETQAVLHANTIVGGVSSQHSSPTVVAERENKENSSQSIVKNSQILSKHSIEPKLLHSEPDSSNDITPSSSNSPSSRSQNFNAIRKSLNQLSLSLEVPSSATSDTSVLGNSADSDLAARLARLKSLGASSNSSTL